MRHWHGIQGQIAIFHFDSCRPTKLGDCCTWRLHPLNFNRQQGIDSHQLHQSKQSSCSFRIQGFKQVHFPRYYTPTLLSLTLFLLVISAHDYLHRAHQQRRVHAHLLTIKVGPTQVTMSSPTPSPLDIEIESLKSKSKPTPLLFYSNFLTHRIVTTLKSNLRIQTSTILSSPPTTSLLSNPPSSSQLKPKGITPTILKSLRHYASLQKAHNQQSLYRTCATITTFRVQDPDPNAVDGGAVLGLRIEVFARGRFVRPYYVLMNRPFAAGSRKENGKGTGNGGKENGKEKSRGKKGKYANWLRVHRHTIPPCVPLSGLAARYLPAPPARPDEQGREQDLVKFARRLRRELVRYHHRLATITDLRKAILAEAESETNKIQDVTPADAEAKQITIEWEDGQTGRLVMGDDGEIVQVVALNGSGGQGGGSGRDREVVRELVGQAKRVEDVVRRLRSGTKG